MRQRPEERCWRRAGRRRKGRHDEELVSRTLGALGALWQRLGAGGGSPAEAPPPEAAAELARAAAVLAPLAGSLQGREARGALCAALGGLAALLPELAPAAEELAALNALSATQVGGTVFVCYVVDRGSSERE